MKNFKVRFCYMETVKLLRLILIAETPLWTFDTITVS